MLVGEKKVHMKYFLKNKKSTWVWVRRSVFWPGPLITKGVE